MPLKPMQNIRIEKRQQARFLANNGSFAAFGHEFITVGSIKNIGMGGLAFEHINDEDRNHESLQRVDIFVPNHDFYLSGVPCRAVYNVPLRTTTVLATPITIKIYGVAFDTLTESQTEKLTLFLEHYTQG